MIRHIGSRWCLFTKDGSRKLGCHDTKAEAEAQERLIIEHQRRAEFSEDQPRDDQGQWTSGGGAASGRTEEIKQVDTNAEVAVAETHGDYMDRLEVADQEGDREHEGMMNAISEYTADGAGRWNNDLRHNPDYMDEDDDEEDTSAVTEREMMRNLADAIDGAPKLKEPITVYRGVTKDLNEISVKRGDTIEMHGFQSTSMNPNVAAKHASKGSQAVLLRITAKRGLYVGGHSRGGEDEFIINHQERFKVVRSFQGRVGSRTFKVYEVHQQ